MGTTQIRNFGSDALGLDPVKNELILMIFSPPSQIKINGDIAFDIAIEGIKTLANQPAIKVLNAMAGIVERVLVATEAECRRLGFIS